MSAQSSAARRFGQEVRRLREGRGLSQEQLAENAGLHRTFVGRIERGETNLTLQNIIRIAKGLGTKASVLVQAVD
ncbi:MAG TPA: helix-turn-helix transcriptional regulator [Vicinamibacterales bacterium]|nr:helix-turn-helix transcriptional regulator [Vicinamibacterales bacterium]